MNKGSGALVFVGIILAVILLLGSRFYRSVPAGHVAVATLFGEVQDQPYEAGLHFPVNPMYEWVQYDAREQSHLERALVPSQDQLQTTVELSVQFRINAAMAPDILRETGTFDKAVSVHLIPKLRSLLREQGKSVQRAEDFFQKTTVETMQARLFDLLKSYLAPKGIVVEAVLVRQISLPPSLLESINEKKQREQEVDKQKAELERYRTEQQQKIAMAEAEKRAAEEEAAKIRVLADAEAYQIEKINSAISNNPAYIQLKALDALKDISKDPSSKVYFINGDSPQPLPLMHMGEGMNK